MHEANTPLDEAKNLREIVGGLELDKIENCPRHRAAGLDVFGRPVGCRCGYPHVDRFENELRRTGSLSDCTYTRARYLEKSVR